MTTEERKDIVDRVVAWNSARFDKVYNYELECKMLLEEVQELYDAKTTVEKLDAIGDIIFVAIGSMWKIGLGQELIKAFLYSEEIGTLNLVEANDHGNSYKSICIDEIDHSIPAAWTGLTLAIDATLLIAVGQLRTLGMGNYFYDVVEAICDSNDTKVCKGKVDNNQKANIDKGTTFVPPTSRLIKIINSAALDATFK